MFHFFKKEKSKLKDFMNKPFIKSRYRSIYFLMLDIDKIINLNMLDRFPKLDYVDNIRIIETSLWFVDSDNYVISDVLSIEKELKSAYKKLKKYKKYYENNLNFKYSIYNQQIINILLTELYHIFDE